MPSLGRHVLAPRPATHLSSQSVSTQSTHLEPRTTQRTARGWVRLRIRGHAIHLNSGNSGIQSPYPPPARRFSPTGFIRRDENHASYHHCRAADKRYSLGGSSAYLHSNGFLGADRSCMHIDIFSLVTPTHFRRKDAIRGGFGNGEQP